MLPPETGSPLWGRQWVALAIIRTATLDLEINGFWNMCLLEHNLFLGRRPLPIWSIETEDVLLWEFGELGSDGMADGEGLGAEPGRLNLTRGLLSPQLHFKK